MIPSTTPLGERIARQIAATGPIGIAEYMALCMNDPVDGYYARPDTIGARGDFITAPETSQMFGELIGVWCVSAWQALGRPAECRLVEAGPGRGTLLRDLLRAVHRFAEFDAAIDLRLIETSAAMIAHQHQAIEAAGLHFAGKATWHTSLAEVPAGPLILVANEFLDVLPFRQYVKAGEVWHERCVGFGEDGSLRFALGPALIDPSLLPPGAPSEPDGAVYEYAPAREAWVAALAERLARDGGVALLIDYGHAESGFGDTFQAMRGHGYADPLESPGLADLTSHVDFAALSRAAMAAGAHASVITEQGEFLLSMGLLERAGALGAKGDEETRQRLRGEVERLAHHNHMGRLFKVLALSGGMLVNGQGSNTLGFPPFSALAGSDVKES